MLIKQLAEVQFLIQNRLNRLVCSVMQLLYERHIVTGQPKHDRWCTADTTVFVSGHWTVDAENLRFTTDRIAPSLSQYKSEHSRGYV